MRGTGDGRVKDWVKDYMKGETGGEAPGGGEKRTLFLFFPRGLSPALSLYTIPTPDAHLTRISTNSLQLLGLINCIS